MKTIDKTKVFDQRRLGFGYKRIAKELSMATDEVRKVCIELGNEGLFIGKCKQCGIAITATKGKKIKQYCSDQCRWDWWNNYYKK